MGKKHKDKVSFNSLTNNNHHVLRHNTTQHDLVVVEGFFNRLSIEEDFLLSIRELVLVLFYFISFSL
jgi:hypothetical protein